MFLHHQCKCLFCHISSSTCSVRWVANLIFEAASKFEVLIKEFGSFDVFTLKQGSECRDELLKTANLQDIINDGSYFKRTKEHWLFFDLQGAQTSEVSWTRTTTCRENCWSRGTFRADPLRTVPGLFQDCTNCTTQDLFHSYLNPLIKTTTGWRNMFLMMPGPEEFWLGSFPFLEGWVGSTLCRTPRPVGCLGTSWWTQVQGMNQTVG